MKINSLVITRQPVYPPVGGAPLRNWQTINILDSLGDVSVFEIDATGYQSPSKDVPVASQYKAVKTSNKSSKNSIITVLKRNLWIIKAKAHPWIDSVFYCEKVAKELHTYLSQVKPDIVVIEELWIIKYLSVIRQFKCVVILDAHNIEGVLRGDILKKSKPNHHWLKHFIRKLKIKRLMKAEAKAIESVEQTWVCSDNEIPLIKNFYNCSANVKVIPNGIDVDDFALVRNNAYERPKELPKKDFVILFPATFGYPPNSEGVNYLIDEILPRLQHKTSQFKIALVGRNPTPKMLQLNHKDVVVTGGVDDMMPYWAAADLVIVPLLQGGGTRLKILEAFAAKRPVLSTTKGAEGIGYSNDENILIADDADEIVSRIIQLKETLQLRTNLAINGFDLVQRQYSRHAIGKKISDEVALLLKT